VRGGAGFLLAAFVVALVTPLGSRAEDAAEKQTGAPKEQAAPAEDATSDSSDATAEEEAGFRWRRFELRGRAIVRAQSIQEESRSQSDVSAEDARLTLRWRPARWLRGELEYDAAGNRGLRDAFVRVRHGAFALRGGQFKPPMSAIEMDSRWDLPVSERGLLSDILEDAMGIVGRRPGLQASFSPRGSDLTARLGLFRASSVRGDRIGDEAFDNLAKDWALKATGRVSWQRRRLEVGLSGDWRPAEPRPGEGYERFWTASLDASWSQRPRRGGLRFWVEGLVGSSWQDANAFDGEPATFVAGRALGAWRHGGRRRREFYVEPYTAISLFDPDASVRDDLLWEIAGGLNVGSWDRLRLTLEMQHRGVGANAPLSLGLFGAGAAPPLSRTKLVAQIGGAF